MDNWANLSCVTAVNRCTKVINCAGTTCGTSINGIILLDSVYTLTVMSTIMVDISMMNTVLIPKVSYIGTMTSSMNDSLDSLLYSSVVITMDSYCCLVDFLLVEIFLLVRIIRD